MPPSKKQQKPAKLNKRATQHFESFPIKKLPAEIREEIFTLVLDEYFETHEGSQDIVLCDAKGNAYFSDPTGALQNMPLLERALIGEPKLYREFFYLRIKRSVIHCTPKPEHKFFTVIVRYPDLKKYSPLFRNAIRSVVLPVQRIDYFLGPKDKETSNLQSVESFFTSMLQNTQFVSHLVLPFGNLSDVRDYSSVREIIFPALKKLVECKRLKSFEIKYKEYSYRSASLKGFDNPKNKLDEYLGIKVIEHKTLFKPICPYNSDYPEFRLVWAAVKGRVLVWEEGN